MDTPDPASLPYEEPSILTILILSSFLLLLNAVNHVLDKLIFCGLIGQILLGIAWGTPGARLLGVETERLIVNLGYLGLILLVYEGGLSTSFKSLKANIYLSIAVALTGISLPIALSFVLLKLANATPLQAFAAGAALCSTSLGTTFAVLRTSGLVKTRMGVVLSTAAMMDDVVGLVMVQVISNLGNATSQSFNAITVIRPVFVSLAFAVCTPVCTYMIVRPATRWLNNWREWHRTTKLASLVRSQSFATTVHTALLIAMVAGSSYAGTSNLFAAYLAGAAVSWWDTELPHLSQPVPPSNLHNITTDASKESTQTSRLSDQRTNGADTFETYYGQALTRILKPFFFASIGFSIPITELFRGQVVWRGLIYTILMFTGKLACGLWLLKFPEKFWKTNQWSRWTEAVFRGRANNTTTIEQSNRMSIQTQHQSGESVELTSNIVAREQTSKTADEPPRKSNEGRKMRSASTNLSLKSKQVPQHEQSSMRKPISIYPSLILGSAMTARGEIGFLISSLAQSNNIFSPSYQSQSEGSSQGESPIFLIVTWAIMLCTIIGPILVGIVVRRVKKLKEKTAATHQQAGVRDVLGDWGVE